MDMVPFYSRVYLPIDGNVTGDCVLTVMQR